ncbi:putative TrkA N-terminal domain protein [uncultured spirochete]|jgi:trk system potassium uptake protein TrkA|uniref:Putative TrkA N-terminal domain protein n=1 Tax=uncultured spirochete TaxID=156406 RepID=A0A3P3XJZ5_9SPIR|nr:TrkA family potassium uptake protein [Rectinema subterraneum]SLM14063.1 putative TrkA N-terminal domain protein [uncultured spirochete]
MRQFAFVGLGSFAMSMLERIAEITDQIIAVDDDQARIEHVKEMVSTAYTMNLLDGEAFERVFHDPVDVAIVDVESNGAAVLLVTFRLKKLGVPEIIVKSNSEEYEELLRLVGATRVVNSDREAATRITPLVLSSSLTNFMPISGDLVLAEVIAPDFVLGKTVIETDLRRKHHVNVVAVKHSLQRNVNEEAEGVFNDLDIAYRFQAGDVLLVTGKESDVFVFSGVQKTAEHEKKKVNFSVLLKSMFSRKKQDDTKK